MGVDPEDGEGDQTRLESVEEGEGEEDEDEENDEGGEEDEEGDETAVEAEEGEEDFTQQFIEEGLEGPSTPAPTNGAPTQVPMTPKTPARSRKTPKTPSASKEAQSAAASSRPKKKKKKSKPRKSQLSLDALTHSQAALEALNSSHTLHLRLRKKYYNEGLQFIKMIEGSMGVMSQLLVSTSKAEVLESMEFFRVAREYEMDCAQVCRHSFFLLTFCLARCTNGS